MISAPPVATKLSVPQVPVLNASGSALTLAMVRTVKDNYGEDVLLVGSKAQRRSYEDIGLILSAIEAPMQAKRRFYSFWLAGKFVLNAAVPSNELWVQLANGNKFLAITNLAVPAVF